MSNSALEEFSRSMNALLDEDTSKLLKVDQAAVEQYRNDKSTYQRWRKVIADNMDDVRDFRRLTDGSTEAETAIKRLQADLAHHQAKNNDQKELSAESQPVADELRELVDAAKRWSEDANRIAVRQSRSTRSMPT
jgi:predicted transcriptional regulator